MGESNGRAVPELTLPAVESREPHRHSALQHRPRIGAGKPARLEPRPRHKSASRGGRGVSWGPLQGLDEIRPLVLRVFTTVLVGNASISPASEGHRMPESIRSSCSAGSRH